MAAIGMSDIEKEEIMAYHTYKTKMEKMLAGVTGKTLLGYVLEDSWEAAVKVGVAFLKNGDNEDEEVLAEEISDVYGEFGDDHADILESEIKKLISGEKLKGEEDEVDSDIDDEVVKPKAKAVKVIGKCGGVKKDGEPCMFKACEEDGFCKRHSKVVTPKVKAAKVAKEVRDWGEWEDIDSDCEEDPDFDYQYEEVWVEC
jgi:hypothetical protein